MYLPNCLLEQKLDGRNLWNSIYILLMNACDINYQVLKDKFLKMQMMQINAFNLLFRCNILQILQQHDSYDTHTSLVGI